MSSPEHTVFVCSATGLQGGGVARKLREIGWNVHATTRDLNSSEASALKDIGVYLNECDWDNSIVLRETIKGCDKLFLCLTPDWDDPSRERRQTQTILDIAKSVGVTQVIASTTLGVSQLDANVRVYPGSFMEKHMINKKSVETAVSDRNFTHYTFLRPTFFMANFLTPKVNRYPELRDHRSWTTSMTDETELPIIDHLDIAKFAVAAFQRPEEFHARKMGLASQLLRLQPMMDLLAEAVGEPGTFKAYFMTDEEIEVQAQGTGFASTHKVLRTASEYVDLEELGGIAALTTFKEFLEREREAVRRTYPLLKSE